jgi:DNA processing protein
MILCQTSISQARQNMDNKLFFLALNRIDGIGPRTVFKLLSHWPNLADLFNLSFTQMTQAGLPDKMARLICDFDLRLVDQDLAWQKENTHHLLTWDSPHYPRLLKEIGDPPTVLYAKGDLACLTNPTLAIVGTRKPSIIGAETAYRFASQLSRNGITIVSGLALGIDAQAHRGCLTENGSTIAVLGTGIDQIYPPQNRLLFDQIAKKGLLLSEFPLGNSPKAGHFPRRNRIISGVSLSTLVIEAAIKSGSLITARFAMEQNRDVLAIPGSIHNVQAKGCHYLLQQGARLVESEDDVLDALGVTEKIADLAYMQSTLASGMENLVKCIGFETTTIDQIVRRSQLCVEKVLCGVSELELHGMIKSVPGGYMRCRQ